MNSPKKTDDLVAEFQQKTAKLAAEQESLDRMSADLDELAAEAKARLAQMRKETADWIAWSDRMLAENEASYQAALDASNKRIRTYTRLSTACKIGAALAGVVLVVAVLKR